MPLDTDIIRPQDLSERITIILLLHEMDEYTPEAFSNREEPVPLLTVANNDDDSPSSDGASSKRRRLKESLSRSKLGERAHDLTDGKVDKMASPTGKGSIQDRLFSK